MIEKGNGGHLRLEIDDSCASAEPGAAEPIGPKAIINGRGTVSLRRYYIVCLYGFVSYRIIPYTSRVSCLLLGRRAYTFDYYLLLTRVAEPHIGNRALQPDEQHCVSPCAGFMCWTGVIPRYLANGAGIINSQTLAAFIVELLSYLMDRQHAHVGALPVGRLAEFFPPPSIIALLTIVLDLLHLPLPGPRPSLCPSVTPLYIMIRGRMASSLSPSPSPKAPRNCCATIPDELLYP
jgi:hypothetical protein